ncbi:MAG: hypothetical protein JXR83_04165 [Deltaproteobacteria bacterium]|nr:hypothetical protein [Deltaproteobacteria bacterium]
MTTARAQLHNEIVEVISGKNKGTVESRLDELLGRYRVQYKKPPADGGKQVTAREALAAKVAAIAKRPGKDPLAQISALLDDFRMQFKSERKADAAPPQARPAGRKSSKPKADAASPAAAVRAGRPAKHKQAAPAAAVAPAQASAATGGKPRSTRSECPKCHSMGVVLARSYAADEYFSCIYCGWQGYKPPDAAGSDDSLAARLLGLYSSAGEPDDESGGSDDDKGAGN